MPKPENLQPVDHGEMRSNAGRNPEAKRIRNRNKEAYDNLLLLLSEADKKKVYTGFQQSLNQRAYEELSEDDRETLEGIRLESRYNIALEFMSERSKNFFIVTTQMPNAFVGQAEEETRLLKLRFKNSNISNHLTEDDIENVEHKYEENILGGTRDAFLLFESRSPNLAKELREKAIEDMHAEAFMRLPKDHQDRLENKSLKEMEEATPAK